METSWYAARALRRDDRRAGAVCAPLRLDSLRALPSRVSLPRAPRASAEPASLQRPGGQQGSITRCHVWCRWWPTQPGCAALGHHLHPSLSQQLHRHRSPPASPPQPLAHPSLWPSPRVAVVLALPPCPSAGVGVEGCNSWMHPDPLRHQGITRGRGAVQFQRCCSWGRWGRDPKGTPPPRCARKHLRRRRQWRSLSCCPHQKPRPRLPGLVGGSSGC